MMEGILPARNLLCPDLVLGKHQFQSRSHKVLSTGIPKYVFKRHWIVIIQFIDSYQFNDS